MPMGECTGFFGCLSLSGKQCVKTCPPHREHLGHYMVSCGSSCIRVTEMASESVFSPLRNSSVCEAFGNRGFEVQAFVPCDSS